MSGSERVGHSEAGGGKGGVLETVVAWVWGASRAVM